MSPRKLSWWAFQTARSVHCNKMFISRRSWVHLQVELLFRHNPLLQYFKVDPYFVCFYMHWQNIAKNYTCITVYSLLQCKLELRDIGGTVDHGTAFGRIAFSCPREQVRGHSPHIEWLLVHSNIEPLMPSCTQTFSYHYCWLREHHYWSAVMTFVMIWEDEVTLIVKHVDLMINKLTSILGISEIHWSHWVWLVINPHLLM